MSLSTVYSLGRFKLFLNCFTKWNFTEYFYVWTALGCAKCRLFFVCCKCQNKMLVAFATQGQIVANFLCRRLLHNMVICNCCILVLGIHIHAHYDDDDDNDDNWPAATNYWLLLTTNNNNYIKIGFHICSFGVLNREKKSIRYNQCKVGVQLVVSVSRSERAHTLTHT